jgi:phage protein D
VTALLRPAYVLTFRDPGGAGGAAAVPGVAAAAGAAGVGSSGAVIRSTTSPATSTVVELQVELGMDGEADQVVLVLGQVGSFRPTVGQQLTVELGYTDGQDPQRVTVTTVVEGAPDLRRRRIVALSAPALVRTRVDRTFETSTAGAIVRELARAAGLDVTQADDGITFPAYVVDARRSPWHHIGELAALCGFDRYVDDEGKLVFAFFTGGRTSHVFEYGTHILDVRMDRHTAVSGEVTVIGESPGAAQGSDSWAWLARDLAGVTGRVGSGQALLLLERSALRTPSAVRQAAQAALTDLTRRATTGEVTVAGAPQVRLGDALRLSGVPEPGVDGTYQVRSVVHLLRKDAGFTTRISFRGIESPGRTL